MGNEAFYQSSEVKFLFKGIQTTTTGGYIALLFITVAIGVMLEATSFLREYLKLNKEYSELVRRTLLAVTYMFQMALAYIAMLIAMTFNFLLFLAVVVGLVVGYAIFGFLPLQKESADDTYAAIDQQPRVTQKESVYHSDEVDQI